jgi:hypothetical protein
LKHEAENVGALGAEGHAQADLRGPLADGVGHDAIHAEGREEEGEAGEDDK